MKRRAPVGSSLRRRLPICTSTTFVCAIKLKFHTSSSSIARVTTCPGRRMKYSSRVNSRGRRMAARLQFEANLLGEVALVLDDQNWSGGQSVSRPSRRPVPLLLCQRVDVLHIARLHLASFLRRPPFLSRKCNMTGLRKSHSVVVSIAPRGVRTFACPALGITLLCLPI